MNTTNINLRNRIVYQPARFLTLFNRSQSKVRSELNEAIIRSR